MQRKPKQPNKSTDNKTRKRKKALTSNTIIWHTSMIMKAQVSQIKSKGSAVSGSDAMHNMTHDNHDRQTTLDGTHVGLIVARGRPAPDWLRPPQNQLTGCHSTLPSSPLPPLLAEQSSPEKAITLCHFLPRALPSLPDRDATPRRLHYAIKSSVTRRVPASVVVSYHADVTRAGPTSAFWVIWNSSVTVLINGSSARF